MTPEFETVSLQRAAHAQQRSNSIHAEPFSSTLNLKKKKKDSAGRVVESIILLFLKITSKLEDVVTAYLHFLLLQGFKKDVSNPTVYSDFKSRLTQLVTYNDSSALIEY